MHEPRKNDRDPLPDDDDRSAAGEEDPGAALDGLSPAPTGAPAPAVRRGPADDTGLRQP